MKQLTGPQVLTTQINSEMPGRLRRLSYFLLRPAGQTGRLFWHKIIKIWPLSFRSLTLHTDIYILLSKELLEIDRCSKEGAICIIKSWKNPKTSY